MLCVWLQVRTFLKHISSDRTILSYSLFIALHIQDVSNAQSLIHYTYCKLNLIDYGNLSYDIYFMHFRTRTSDQMNRPSFVLVQHTEPMYSSVTYL